MERVSGNSRRVQFADDRRLLGYDFAVGGVAPAAFRCFFRSALLGVLAVGATFALAFSCALKLGVVGGINSTTFAIWIREVDNAEVFCTKAHVGCLAHHIDERTYTAQDAVELPPNNNVELPGVIIGEHALKLRALVRLVIGGFSFVDVGRDDFPSVPFAHAHAVLALSLDSVARIGLRAAALL